MKIFNKYIIVFLFISLFFAIGCQTQPDMEKIKTQVNEMNDIITKAVLENDHETALKMYTEDGISMPSYEPMIKGMEALKAHSENQPPMNMKSFTLTSIDVWVSGNFVVDIGTYDLSIDMPEIPGGEIKDNGKYLTLYEIQPDGSLLMKADIWNTDLNPWENMMDHNGEDKDK